MRLFSQKQKMNEVYAGDLLLEIDEVNRKKIQSALLGMLLDVQEICQRNRIQVYLCGGSALGAVRHKGFIPWDDDIDISMTRADFNKFKSVFENELSDRYVLNAPNYSKKAKSRFPKIMKKGTVFRELWDTSDLNNCGLFLDIFILDYVPDNKLCRMYKGILCNVMEFIGGQVAMVETTSEAWRYLNKRAGKISYYFRCFCGKVFSYRSASGWYDQIDRIIQHSNMQSKYCSLATGSGHYFGEILKRTDYIPAVPIEFEGHQVYVFHNVHKYLSNHYGEDYLVPPPERKRQKHFIKELSLD